jgi:ubiquinone/menaquinone biosynthesis C-methylase UbiE
MSTISKTDATYVMGHQAGEEVRLQKLGQLLYSSTRYLFEKAGIEPGMKVLDVGSGAGDVTLLLAELVGPTGSIVGVDVYPTVLEVARARVRAARLNNITFIAEDIRKVSG